VIRKAAFDERPATAPGSTRVVPANVNSVPDSSPLPGRPGTDHPRPDKPATAPRKLGKRAPRVDRESEQERKALFREAIESARKLKRGHRALYDADPKAFRATVSKAQSRVFRLKPGPKQNAQIVLAARERARGVPWQDLFPKYIENYSSANEFVRALLETGFQRKVNQYLQRRRSIRRRAQGTQDKPRPDLGNCPGLSTAVR